MGRPHTISTHTHTKIRTKIKSTYNIAHIRCATDRVAAAAAASAAFVQRATHSRAGYEFVKNFSRDGRGIDLQSC